MLTQREFVEGCLNYYREADLQPGNPEDGNWDEAHYPVPKCKGGTETVLLLKEHHAVQGVLQSEEFQWRCFFDWEKNYLSGEYLELFHKWRSEGQRLFEAQKTEEEKVLFSEKCRVAALTRETRMTEEEKRLRSEQGKTQLSRKTEEEKRLSANKIYETWKRKRDLRFKQEAQELLAQWKQGVVRRGWE